MCLFLSLFNEKRAKEVKKVLLTVNKKVSLVAKFMTTNIFNKSSNHLKW